MNRRPNNKSRIAEIQRSRRFHELLRQDRALDAEWLKDQARGSAKAERKSARIDGLVRTAEARIVGSKDYPSPLAVRQMRRIVEDTSKPARLRIAAAARILEWAE